jgi:nitrogen regulatory protein PII
MSKLVSFITTQIEKGLAIAEAWDAAGASGVTIIDSFGLYHLRQRSKAVELPLFVSMAQVMREIEQTNQTIFSVVDDDLVDSLIEASCKALGTDTLAKPDTGVAFVIDVERTIGMPPYSTQPTQGPNEHP